MANCDACVKEHPAEVRESMEQGVAWSGRQLEGMVVIMTPGWRHRARRSRRAVPLGSGRASGA